MSELKEFTLDQLSKLSTPTNLHLLISGKVYAIAKFLEDHPGGDEVLLSEAGKDASESFEDVGHSEEARTLMKQYLVGTCTQGVPKSPSIDKKPAQQASTSASNHQSGGGLGFMVPLALLAGYLSYPIENIASDERFIASNTIYIPIYLYLIWKITVIFL
ncbi:hypothetical protein H4Q26_017417 [Puccinia striiformis f. sp. tritici PST-130]|nr:hypothetical protein H4Q26_017417 [Puccinia striiformis f. sp. tritici PST-130]